MAGSRQNLSKAVLTGVGLELLAEGRTIRFRAGGRSMLPHILDGDVVLVRPVEPQSLRYGDIILYRQPGGTGALLHRITAIRKRAGRRIFFVRGDAALFHVDRISAEDIAGQAIAIERNGCRIGLDSVRVRLLGRLWHCRRRLIHYLRRH